MDRQQILAESTLFNGLQKEYLDQLTAITYEKTYERGETIFFDGDICNGFYLVGTGKVKIFKMSFSGKEQILHIFGPGEPFGEVPVFNGTPFPASAQPLVKSTVVFIPRDKFIQLIEKRPEIALNMLAILSFRLRRFTVQIENLSLKEVPARLSAYLLYLMKEQNNEEVVSLEISKGQLASLLGTIPETLSRIFAKMSEEKLIQVAGRDIRVIDKEGLEMRAE